AADFDRVISINLRGSFFVGRMAIGLMEGTVEVPARLIMTASDLVYYRRETLSPYVASKHGVLGLVRSWAKEFAPRVGLRCAPAGGGALALGSRRLGAICPVYGSRLHDADPRARAGLCRLRA